MFVASLLCLTARAAASIEVEKKGWLILAVSFLVLASLELGGTSHGTFIEFSRYVLQSDDIRVQLLPLFVIPFWLLFSLRPFLRALPPRYAVAFVALGIIYSIGVLGMEMGSQWVAIEYGRISAPYYFAAGIEETLEAVGMFGFCIAGSNYLRRQSTRVEEV